MSWGRGVDIPDVMGWRSRHTRCHGVEEQTYQMSWGRGVDIPDVMG